MPALSSIGLRGLPLVALIGAWTGVASVARGVEAPDCARGISPETTRHVFDLVAKTPRVGTCDFGGVSTDKSILRVHWTAEGKELPDLVVRPRQCVTSVMVWSDALTVDVPKELAQRCPGLASLVQQLGGTLEQEAAVGDMPARNSGSIGAYVTLVALLIGLLAALFAKFPQADVSRLWSLVLGTGIVGGAAWLRLSLPVRRALDGGDIERLYRTACCSVWQQLASPQDVHHPGLWFALVRVPFEWSGHNPAVAAWLDRLFAILAVPLAGWLVRSFAGRLEALWTMAIVALFPMLAEHAQQLSDFTLFVALSLACLVAYERAVSSPTPLRCVAVAVLLGLDLNASYAAPIVIGALLVDATLRWRSHGRLLGAILLGALAGVPRIHHLTASIPMELAGRQEARILPWHHWANRSFGEFLRAAGDDYFTPAYAFLLVPLLALTLVLNGRLIWARRPLVLSMVGFLLLLALQPVVRVKTYYGILLPVLLVALVASVGGAQSPTESLRAAAVRRALSHASLIAVLLVFAGSLPRSRAKEIANASSTDPTRTIVAAMQAEGARTLVIDNNHEWTAATYQFLEDPYRVMGEFLRPPTHDWHDEIDEAASGRRIVALTSDWSKPNWQARSIARLASFMKEGPVDPLLAAGSPNDALRDFVSHHCRALAQAGDWTGWHCPRE